MRDYINRWLTLANSWFDLILLASTSEYSLVRKAILLLPLLLFSLSLTLSDASLNDTPSHTLTGRNGAEGENSPPPAEAAVVVTLGVAGGSLSGGLEFLGAVLLQREEKSIIRIGRNLFIDLLDNSLINK